MFDYFRDEDFEEIYKLAHYEEVRNTEYRVFTKEDAASVFNVSIEDIEYYIYKIKLFSKSNGMKKAFNKSFTEYYISVLGMYWICLLNEDSDNELFRRYAPFFANQGIKFALKLLGNLPSEKTEKRKSHSGYVQGIDYEDILMMQNMKKIPSELKTMKEVTDTSHFFYSKKVVITGTFEKFPFREEMAKLLHDVGADVNVSISRKTDYVIVGENAGPKKMEKIKELGIETIDESKFIELFKL
ncbi:BRCT domain-containing protein [Riemerella columbipharyngis]|uniref:BRCA1 C Terminus (BRCT) domain-containing protein n=1 Tax=Riemerella columbipharyngis TaxID=1071918 RepID=A0A1G7E106_9FLAO|nr:BRCT domain-containing protein [Riemerella columbipharyngis]SDE57364.1 BRCA1 C Terminus (BRCT) domain-containing protein [Riemerella columbipharyngis]